MLSSTQPHKTQSSGPCVTAARVASTAGCNRQLSNEPPPESTCLELGRFTGKHYSTRHVATAFKHADRDSSGGVDFNEFIQLWQRKDWMRSAVAERSMLRGSNRQRSGPVRASLLRVLVPILLLSCARPLRRVSNRRLATLADADLACVALSPVHSDVDGGFRSYSRHLVFVVSCEPLCEPAAYRRG